MARWTDWDLRLLAWEREWLRRPHSWDKESDCGYMTAAAMLAVADMPDPMAPLRGKYATEFGCRRALLELGFSSPAEYLASLVPEHKTPAHARRGDIGVAGNLPGEPLVVVRGHIIHGIGPKGLEALPRAQLTRAFIIG